LTLWPNTASLDAVVLWQGDEIAMLDLSLRVHALDALRGLPRFSASTRTAQPGARGPL